MVVGPAALQVRCAGAPGDGRSRPVARLAGTWASAGVGDEAPVEKGPMARCQKWLGRSCLRRGRSEPVLQLHELFVVLGPSPRLGWHNTILADSQPRAGSEAPTMATLVQ